MIKPYVKTAQMAAGNKWNAGPALLLPSLALRAAYLVPMLLLWRVLAANGADAGMRLSQLLSYTLMGALLDELINLRSPLTDWIYDGPLVGVYLRPMSLYGHVFAESLGAALPGLCLFTLPMLAVSPLLGVSVVPQSLWFFPSLALTVSLAFAVEFLFAALLVRLVNASWLIYSIRSAVTWLFSGSVIPFAALPWGLGRALSMMPFGSLGGAPLSLFVGLASPWEVLPIQLFWNAILWPLAALAFEKSRERMVSHGG